MVNYKNTKVYKIVFPGGETITGSTTKQYLSQRKTQINYMYKKFLEKEVDEKSPPILNRFYILMNKYGPNSYNIILINTVEGNSKDEVNAILCAYH